MNTHEMIPLSDQYRGAARDWVQNDGKARMLEESKTSVLAKMMKALGDKPVAAAERDVKASQEWHDFITELTLTRTAANMSRVEMDTLMMKHEEAMRR